MKSRQIAAVFLSLALLTSTVGCTKSPAPSQSPAQPDASSSEPAQSNASQSASSAPSPLSAAIQKVVVDKAPVSITFWTGTGNANYPFLESMVQAFQKEYPNITVDFSNQGAIADLTSKLTQNIVSGTTPNLSNLNGSTFPEYIQSNAIIDLTEYYNDPTIGFSSTEQAGFFQSYIDEAKSFGPEGTMYAFPTNKKTTDILVYNKTFFDAHGWSAPTTWDQVVEYCKVIHSETGKPGFSYDTSYGEAAFKTLSSQWGSPYVSKGGAVDINNQASLDALNFYKSNMDLGYFTLPAMMPSAGGNNSSNGFVMEECYMFVGAAAGVSYAIPKAESGHKNFVLGVAPIPQKNASAAVTFSKGENYAIFANSSDEQRVATWLLIKFLSGAEENVEWLSNTGNLPISNAMVENADYQKFLSTPEDNSPLYYKAAAVNAALQMKDFTRSDIAFDKADSFTTEVGAMWKSIMVGGADVASSLEKTAAMFQ